MNKGRKITGGKYHSNRKKKHYEKRNQERHVTIGEPKRKQIRTRSGKKKVILLNTNLVNVLVNGKTKQAEIKNVNETPQNKFLARQNRLIKSAIIETSLGSARITNRPSQEGFVNAVLLKKD